MNSQLNSKKKGIKIWCDAFVVDSLMDYGVWQYSLVPSSKASIFLKATLRLWASWTFPNIELYEGGGEDPEK